MVEVDGDFCPFLDQTCIKRPREMSYRCLEYKKSGACQTGTSHKHFCVDKYEWPNKAGETPAVMKTWYEAKHACEGIGKRLCSQDEWTLACEGPEHLPYPYGQARDATACNIDKPHPSVDEKALKSSNPATRDSEVERLWQGEPSGSRERCVSPFGVHDMTGNVDEWTVNETGKPHNSALKGGYWSWVRGRCRAVTAGHDESFRYYQIGFRCCSDPSRTNAVSTPSVASAAPSSPPIVAASPPPMRAPTPPPPPPPVLAPPIDPGPPRDIVRGPQKGAIDVPGNAADHRIFIDGKVMRSSPGVIVMDCGPHVAKIGHDGREQPIDVPCGGRVRLAYP
jgi:formylglycine-generating enzyme